MTTPHSHLASVCWIKESNCMEAAKEEGEKGGRKWGRQRNLCCSCKDQCEVSMWEQLDASTVVRALLLPRILALLVSMLCSFSGTICTGSEAPRNLEQATVSSAPNGSLCLQPKFQNGSQSTDSAVCPSISQLPWLGIKYGQIDQS